jgi:4-carboxymuconolactone decarboxylase
MAQKQTAGRDRLGHLAPTFAHLNDDVLFGEVWSREDELSARDRSMITIAALFSAGLYPQLESHLKLGRAHGITKQEAVEIVTQLAFYCGWPKAWSTFPLIREVYGDEESELEGVPSNLSVFPVGEKNPYGQYFIGQSYLADLGAVMNVTFEPRCRNNWHVHHKQVQVLICVAGRGWYQEWGKPAVPLTPGTVIAIPAEAKHWHGAARDSWLQHLTYHKDVQQGASNEWLEPVDDEWYDKLE